MKKYATAFAVFVLLVWAAIQFIGEDSTPKLPPGARAASNAAAKEAAAQVLMSRGMEAKAAHDLVTAVTRSWNLGSGLPTNAVTAFYAHRQYEACIKEKAADLQKCMLASRLAMNWLKTQYGPSKWLAVGENFLTFVELCAPLFPDAFTRYPSEPTDLVAVELAKKAWDELGCDTKVNQMQSLQRR